LLSLVRLIQYKLGLATITVVREGKIHGSLQLYLLALELSIRHSVANFVLQIVLKAPPCLKPREGCTLVN